MDKPVSFEWSAERVPGYECKQMAAFRRTLPPVLPGNASEAVVGEGGVSLKWIAKMVPRSWD